MGYRFASPVDGCVCICLYLSDHWCQGRYSIGCGETGDGKASTLDCFVVTCEHGGNRVPAAYKSLFVGHEALLGTHRGYDAGALIMAQELSKAFGAQLVASTTTRLLVDLNRSIGHPRLFFEATAAAGPELRSEIVDHHYAPYRGQVENLVAKAIGSGLRVVHLSSHSFTPVLDGDVRDADVGLLYDPSRPGEAALCARWKASLACLAPRLKVRRNYPYLGKGDGFASHLRKRFGPDDYVGIELELNQRTVFGPEQDWKALRVRIVESLKAATNT